MAIPLETAAALDKLIPPNCEKVIYNPVKANHLVFDMAIRQYRTPYAGEVGMRIRQFLSVVRVKP
jgi:hypothetical protein